MAVKRNGKGYSHANALIMQGKVNRTGEWSFSGDDGNAILGDDNWTEYGKWFMGVDDAADPKTKEHYKYPFGKGGKVYRRALIAIKSRAAQQGETEIADAADKCLAKVDKGKAESRAAMATVRCDAGMVPTELPSADDNVPPMEFRIFEKGEVSATWIDGRRDTFLVDDDAVSSIMDAYETHGVDIEIDYDHVSSRPVTNDPRPAAGWAKLEARDDGVWALVQRWTDRAAAMLSAREYRYFSPDFVHEVKAPKRIVTINAIALVNRPALDGQMPLAASATAPAPETSEQAATAVADNPPTQENEMAKVIEVLGVQTEDEAVASIETMRATMGERETALASAVAATAAVQTELAAAVAARDASDKLVTEILSAAGCEKREDVVGVVARHRDAAADVAKAREQMAAIQKQREDEERATLIASACVAHDRAEWLKKQPIETVRSYVSECCKAPEIATTPQSADAATRTEEVPDPWFRDLPHIEKLPKDKQLAEWRAYLTHKESVKDRMPSYAAADAAGK